MASITLDAPTDLKVVDGRVNLTRHPVVIAALKERAEQKKIEDAGKAAEKRRKELDALLDQVLGDADEGIVRGVVAIKRMHSRSRKVDNALLDTAFPEASAACVTYVPFTFIKVNV